MENVILIIHLILALCMIGLVLLQRSEGGGLGMGGGGAATGRPAMTALGKLTWVFAAAFFSTSIALTVLATQNSDAFSVVDGTVEEPQTVQPPDLDVLLPPVLDGSQTTPSANTPLLPPAVD